MHAWTLVSNSSEGFGDLQMGRQVTGCFIKIWTVPTAATPAVANLLRLRPSVYPSQRVKLPFFCVDDSFALKPAELQVALSNNTGRQTTVAQYCSKSGLEQANSAMRPTNWHARQRKYGLTAMTDMLPS